MATKSEVIHAAVTRGIGCLGRADGDEPVFVLRAKDALAPKVIRFWASELMRVSGRIDKANSALDDANAFERWALQHGNKIPD